MTQLQDTEANAQRFATLNLSTGNPAVTVSE
jgi:hypothetical protein